jgi:hypothetical protein
MRIENVNSGEQLTSVGLQLTRSEASELIDSLQAVLGGGVDRHEHVTSADYQKEITVWIQEDDEALEAP